jgi:hypothetical protein
MMRIPPEHVRKLERLALAGVVAVGFSLGLDAAMALAFSLTVMEIDAHFP